MTITIAAHARFTDRYVETSATRDINTALDLAKNTPMVISISGAPGTGKTTALLHRTIENNERCCSITSAHKSVRGLMLLLLEVYGCGFYRDRPSTYDIHNKLYYTLPGYGFDGRYPSLLIIDECQSLNNDAMRELLSMQEHASISLVLSGNDQRLAQTKSHDSALGQIARRIDWRIQLGQPTTEDC